MGLMQFLAVGRSVDRIDDGSTRYKMTQQNLLPKFGSARKADRASGDLQQAGSAPRPNGGGDEAAKAEAPAKLPQGPSPFDAAAAKALRPGLFRRVFMKIAFRRKPRTGDSIRGENSGALRGVPTARQRSFFRNPFSRSPKPTRELRVVQIELLLDAVKPVRNDLSDSDLEVITAPVPSPSDSAAKPALCAGSTQLPAPDGGSELSDEPAWGRIKAQVFGAGKS